MKEKPRPQRNSSASAEPLLDIRGLEVQLNGRDPLTVIDSIDLTVHQGEIIGIVGESGCGKSVLSLAIMGLLAKDMHIHDGEIWYDEKPVHQLTAEQVRKLRGKELAMIFQDPLTSLNPSLTVGQQITEMLRLHLKYTKKQAKEEALRLLQRVGLPKPEALLKAYPHQLSGGMRQRVMIAIALSCGPRLLIADEPTTALDVTIQADILDLLRQIRDEDQTSILFISHDLGVIAELCDRIAVMYAGQIVEQGTANELFDAPKHPYTVGLLQSIPSPDKKHERLYAIPGAVPALHNRNEGCRFYSRCQLATEICRMHQPALVGMGGQHRVRCFAAEQEGGISHGDSARATETAIS
ncbi:ABC transporter ATP-binding protein [Paenibacillus sp. MAHUQ-46]|uniref:ABC transporter ATP-binding protein n=2 Tax=Paenibacillus TaxID=44249 RepID=A0A934J4D0_9BACL|nr:ABC transporter ATP-binding protein [Paenibacillus roseus]MBJ6360118.1 ABC transporter ATP-binding protein [Paenibacillus roseus]